MMRKHTCIGFLGFHLAITLIIIIIAQCFLLCMSSASYARNSTYPDGRTLEDAYGRVYYPNGCEARDSYGRLFYPDSRAARDTYGRLFYPNGREARDTYGRVYYPDGRTLKDTYGNVTYQNGRTARDTYGNTYYENGSNAGGSITITVELGGCGGVLKFRASKHCCSGFLFLALGYDYYLCLDIDSGHCSIEQL